MDAQQFLAEFGHIANAPRGVGKLRELVFAFAVQGTLVQQEAADESAADWLSRLAVTTSELLKRKKIAKRTAFVDIPEHEYPYSLPRGWAFARLGAITNKIGSGSTPRGGREVYVRTGVPFLRSQNIWNDGIRLDDVAFITPAVHENMEGSAVKGNDILLNITGASLGRCALVPTDFGAANVSQHVTIIRPTDSAIRAYLHLCMLSPYTQAMIWERQVGMAREGLSKKVLEQFEIPLPPVNEQSRIVAKVDELMGLCDQLETQQQQRRSLQSMLRQSTLQAVAAATSPHELQTTWARLADNFAQLFDAPEDVKALRDVIFELAMRGILLTDATMEVVTSENDLPGLPTGWVWKTLGQLSDYITSGSRGWKDYIATAGDAFIRSQDIKQDALVFENPAFVALPEKAEGKRTLIKEGDLLLTITGGNVGKCASVPVLKGKAYVSQHVALIRLNDSSLAEFIHYWMINSHGGRGFLARYIYGDKPGLNLTQVASVPVPIPLESDRIRILESLRFCQSMCDRLELQVEAKHKLAAMVAFAATASITGIDSTSEKEAPLKAPQTELIAPLRLGQAPDLKAQAPLATILARHKGELAAKDLWQRFGGEIDAFYSQLKQEVTHGWILEPDVAEMRNAG